MVKHCSYGTCRSDSRHASREHMQGVFFIPFPKPKSNQEKCLLWIKRCGRPHSQLNVDRITKDVYVCSKHFVGGNGPTIDHPDVIAIDASHTERPPKRKRRTSPDLNIYSKETRPTCVGKEKTVHILDDGSVPVVHEPAAVQDSHDDQFSFISLDHNYLNTDNTCTGETLNSPPCSTAEIGVQTDICLDDLTNYSDSELKNRNLLQRRLTMDTVLKDGSSCKFYTGISLALFSVLFQLISPAAETLKYWRSSDTGISEQRQRHSSRILTVKEELVLTLVRCRRGLDVQMLSDMFAISNTTVSRLFTTWASFLYHHLQFLIKWPTKEQVRAKLPKCFKYFPNTRVVIDCTEFYVQKPSLPSAQRVTWSNYKHNNTFKLLVGISPSGTITFLSKLFTGSISDKKIVEQSGFLDKLEYGDDVMADRGFLIRDLVTMKCATLNIPPFAMGKQLSGAAVTKTRRIANARIHVERAIGRLKSFHILQGVIPMNLRPVLDQIVFVCSALCNLDLKLVK